MTLSIGGIFLRLVRHGKLGDCGGVIDEARENWMLETYTLP